jgi:hypothetical protein
MAVFCFPGGQWKKTGRDITLCPVCGQGRMELIKTFIFHNGCLIDAAQLRNRGSPKIKRSLSGPKDSKYEMLFRLSGIYIEKNIIYYQLELQNRSNISYDIDMLRFFIRDKKQSKRTASQELEQFPLYVYGNTGSVEGQSKKIIVVALPKFTIPAKNYCTYS